MNENCRILGASAGVSAFVAIDTCVVAEALLSAGGRRQRRAAARRARHFISREWRLINAQDNIGHGAHLTGAAVGVAACFVSLISRRARDGAIMVAGGRLGPR